MSRTLFLDGAENMLVSLSRWGNALLFVVLLLGIHRVYLTIYRVWFHPLAKVPGPKLLAATRLPFLYQSQLAGMFYKTSQKLHHKYGRTVRVAPDMVMVDGSILWEQAFAHRPAGKEEYPKYPGYYNRAFDITLLSAPKDLHRRQRRHLAPAFSDTAMYEQEGIITHYVDLLVQRLEEHSQNDTPVNIVDWFNFTTFDIIGDLAYGESFHSLETSSYHPWVRFVCQTFRSDAMRRVCEEYPFMYPLLWVAVGPKMVNKAEEFLTWANERADARMELGAMPQDGRKDFMTYMMTPMRGEKGLDKSVIYLLCSTFTVAGSETTATAMSGIIYYLWHNPEQLQVLQSEIRDTFSNQGEINMKAVARLEYLQAVIDETLRLYPPAGIAPTRVCPGEEIDGVYIPRGTGVFTSIWSTFRNPESWADPDDYRPERWLKPTHPRYDAKYANDNRAVFKPFSYGPRDCIGQNLAYAEMRLMTARLIFKFDFKVLDGQSNWTSQFLSLVWDKHPLHVTLTPRKMAV